MIRAQDVGMPQLPSYPRQNRDLIQDALERGDYQRAATAPRDP